MQRPVPAAFEPIEELAHKLVQYRTHPILPDTMSAVVLVDQHKQQAIARANARGLATPDLPPSLSPRQAHGLRLLERVKLTLTLLEAVGEPTLVAIGDAMKDYDVAEDDDWIYLQWVYLEHQGHKVAYFRAILPGHWDENALKEDVLSTAFPVPWDEIYRGYRFDLFGRVIWPSEDTSVYPLPVRWRLTIQQDREQPLNPKGGSRVYLNGRIDIATYCTRAYHPNSPIFAQVEWRPGWKHAQRGTIDPTDDGTPHDPTAALRGLELLERLRGDPSVRMQGKKPGDGALWPGKIPDFLDDLWSTLERYKEATGRKYPLITGKRGDTFRRMMRGAPSERTLGEWLGKAGLRAQDIESRRITRESYARLFSE
jgi:hypothetical protein